MEEILSRECERGNSYKILSECYYLPDENLVDMLNNLSGSAHGLELAGSIPGMDDVESLKVDYSKLFVGPYELLAPPYGSIYLEGRKLMGDSTMEVQNWYAEEGLEITLKEVPDHIAIELEFMCFLISRETEAISGSDPENAIHYLEKQKAFMEIHLGQWVSEFADRVKKRAETEFYRNLANVTDSFIQRDLKDMDELLSDV